jgi:hypothetical protein
VLFLSSVEMKLRTALVRHRDEFFLGRSLSARVELWGDQVQACRPVQGTGPMLFHGPEAETFLQQWATGAVRDDVAAQGRKSFAWGLQNSLERLTPGNPALGVAHLGTQLGLQRADHRADPRAVSLRGRRLGQPHPRVVKRSTHRLHGHVKLGIDRQCGIILVKLDENRGSRGPDSRGRTSTIPAGVTPPVRPFNTFGKDLNGSLGRQHGHLDRVFTVRFFFRWAPFARSEEGTEIANRRRHKKSETFQSVVKEHDGRAGSAVKKPSTARKNVPLLPRARPIPPEIGPIWQIRRMRRLDAAGARGMIKPAIRRGGCSGHR